MGRLIARRLIARRLVTRRLVTRRLVTRRLVSRRLVATLSLVVAPLTKLPDGTVKQVNPFTGTHVWTIPGRGHRPLHQPVAEVVPVDPAQRNALCAFCPDRYLETPPEKARRVRMARGWETAYDLPAERLFETTADFRLIPNLFPILSLDYWRTNHSYQISDREIACRRAYFTSPGGREQVLALIARHAPWLLDRGDDAIIGSGIFGGFHDVVIARRHLTDDRADNAVLASSGTLTPDEHHQFIDFTRAAALRLYEKTASVRNVIVFQNWLRPAGASFDHLHKQLVAIDELGRARTLDADRLRTRPRLVEDYLTLLTENGLIVAETSTALAAAGVGHRFPTLEVWLRRPDSDLANLSTAELADFSALLHACHVAMGPHLPVNEEWHYRAPSQQHAIPLRALMKWRISTPAGFEGNSGIYVNTIDPWGVADRTRIWLRERVAELSPGVRIFD